MTKRLHRYYGTHDLHFITSSCYRHHPELGSAWRRDLFVKILEEARRKYRFVVHGHVVMPEHFSLITEFPFPYHRHSLPPSETIVFQTGGRDAYALTRFPETGMLFDILTNEKLRVGH